MASTVITLAGVNLSLEVASIRSMAFLIFLGMIGFAVVAAGKRRRNPESSSTSLPLPGINYEVFLSFRGPNTRKKFTSHLYGRLVGAGIQVFKDDKDLPAGGKISRELKEAIKRSSISIAILSSDYASSRSCLMELEQMWECSISNGQTIIPIFYDVSPDDVKNQAGKFGESFHQQKKNRANERTIEAWKRVLRQVGGLKGYDLKNINGGDEAQLVEEVLKSVWQELKKDDQYVTDKPVGIDLHVQEVIRKLDVYNDGQPNEASGKDVRVVGIRGMRGVGKTTLANFVFNKMHKLFDGCSFLDDIDSEGVVSSQERLIAELQKEERAPLNSPGEGVRKIAGLFTNMKVLIVLDNVQKSEQIEKLAGKLTWFGPGSRIMVTTNKRDVLKSFDFQGARDRKAEEHEVKPMEDQDALQLFRQHAFQGDASQHVPEYDSLSKDIIKAIGGLPLAIVVTAKTLYVRRENIQRRRDTLERENIKIWRDTLEFLEKNQEDKVEAAFRDSYESLDGPTKEIFLDIACFFIGKNERLPSYMWKACHCYPSRGIKRLRDMHLLEDGGNNELRMHNLLRDFGRKLVEKKVLHERCRFWNHSDALSILKDGKGTESVVGVGLTVEKGCTVSFTCEGFCKISKLRYLRLDRANIEGNAENLLPNLRWLDWRECPLIRDLLIMHLKELVILDLSRSTVTRDSETWSQIMERVKELKVLNLQGCTLFDKLLKNPAPINLEILILEDCTLSSKIGTFISKLEHLTSLNLKNCKEVRQLPDELRCMKSLEELVVDGTDIERIHIQKGSLENLKRLSACDCKNLRDITTIGRLANLSSLDLDRADISRFPETLEFLQLERLSLQGCWKLGSLPTSIGKLKLLEVMDLSCTGIREMPQSVKDLRNLKTLKMKHTFLRKFPEDIVKLENLEEIDFSFCTALEGEVCCDISGLSSLKILRLSSTEVTGLPKSICCLSCLQILEVLDCNQLHALPKLPSSLLSLLWGSKKMRLSDWSYLTNLKELRLTDGEQPKAGWLMMLLNRMTPIGWITRLPSLKTLQLSLSTVTNLPRNFSDLTYLRELSLSYMQELDLTQLPSTLNLSTLRLKHCKIQKPKFSSLKYLSELELDHCDLAKIDGLEDLKLLEVLKISHCGSLTNLIGLDRIGRLRKVQVLFSPRVVLPKLANVEVDSCN